MPLDCWLQGSLTRVFPTGNRVGARAFSLEAARGERAAVQLCVSHASGEEVVSVRAFARAPRGISVRLRRVGFVALARHTTETEHGELDCRGRIPGYVPDPLFDEQHAEIARGQTAAFWATIAVGQRCAAGRAAVEFSVEAGGSLVGGLRAHVLVREALVHPRDGFPIVQSLRSDALMDWYRIEGPSRQYWDILGAYMEDLSAHGQDVVNVPVFARPHLLRVAGRGSTLTIDWTDVKRYLSVARSHGIRRFEWPALPAAHRGVLPVYLRRLKRFLDTEGILELSLFRLGDGSPPVEATPELRRARERLREQAPWMKVTDVVSGPAAAREGIVDMPAADMGTARQLVHEGIPCFGSLCPRPRGSYLGRYLDTPLAKIRMSGWLFYRFGLRGLLGGACNDWYAAGTDTLVDPRVETCARAWPHVAPGERFLVYPGPRGPIDSIRWEVLADGFSDYALLAGRGVEPRSRLLSAIRNFHDFPRSAAWLDKARHALLARAGD